jgi:hypothetical protein
MLGRGLQKLYGDMVEDGVPDHLAQYVEQLETRNDPEAA